MRVTEPRSRTITEPVTTAIKCDRCGKDLMENHYGDQEGTSFTLDFGYGSRFDLDRWEFDICDDCAGWLREQFKTAEVEHDSR